ncbi:MAG: ParB N-terminal domain-containing protein [Gammaproteobacteria bacterium]|nr:ParB N-terminal domain-containing protein [Gammaproteobacteria bacterium]
MTATVYRRSPEGLTPPHGVTEPDKFRRLVDAFRRGESVTPIIVVGDTAVTGSHRLAAAREAGTDIAVVEVPLADYGKLGGGRHWKALRRELGHEGGMLARLYGRDAPILDEVRRFRS